MIADQEPGQTAQHKADARANERALGVLTDNLTKQRTHARARARTYQRAFRACPRAVILDVGAAARGKNKPQRQKQHTGSPKHVHEVVLLKKGC